MPASDADHGARSTSAEERLVLVVPDSQFQAEAGGLDIRAAWQALWNAKGRIAAVTLLFAVGATAYALLATSWWRVEVVLAPADEKTMPAIGGQLGGLAALAGVNLGGSGASIDALAILRSREFARDFIADNDLVPVLFARDWDPERKAWKSSNPRRQRDVRDAVKKFHEDVLRVSQDRQTKIVTLTVDWTDPEMAAQWAGELVRRVNERMRERALRRAEGNMKYLEAELARTNVVTLQQSIGRIVENEMQTVMLARGNEDFAFRVLDGPIVPKYPVRPRKVFVVLLAMLVGGLLTAFVSIAASIWRTGSRGQLSRDSE
jgi:LPS O-antigen subunit length determinant protein (WzzB/FepE family)